MLCRSVQTTPPNTVDAMQIPLRPDGTLDKIGFGYLEGTGEVKQMLQALRVKRIMVKDTLKTA